ncbi:MAG TPA: Xaa-Pro peptidase family protein [Longilinea sp.]|nr:Xaa-Pro peptidase family protein [Longilinea sp.]
MTLTRLQKATQLITENKLDALVLNPGPSLFYLTGLEFHLMERPTVLVITPDQEPALVLPELEHIKVEQSAAPIKTYYYDDNPGTWPAVFTRLVNDLKLDGKLIGVEPLRLRYMELEFLRSAAPHARYTSGDNVVNRLRLTKDADEIRCMRKAVEIAQKALLDTLPLIKPGVTELEIAGELNVQLLRAGSDGELPFKPIVSSGPNSANPHATPSERRMQTGDLLVIDWGAISGGYISDLTRTFAIGHVEDEFEKIAAIVKDANAAGRAASKPNIAAGEVDKAARKVIETAGYGTYFTHRTGHGIGMEPHEPPYMFAENDLILLPGMTYTVEPGIYLTGRGGVRIEDNMVITASGAETLSDMPRELIQL